MELANIVHIHGCKISHHRQYYCLKSPNAATSLVKDAESKLLNLDKFMALDETAAHLSMNHTLCIVQVWDNGLALTKTLYASWLSLFSGIYVHPL